MCSDVGQLSEFRFDFMISFLKGVASMKSGYWNCIAFDQVPL